jgi:hypothetical protein
MQSSASDLANTPEALDILWRLADIAKFINVPPRRARYLLSLGALPVGRVGRHVIASKATLRKCFSALLNGEGANDPPP